MTLYDIDVAGFVGTLNAMHTFCNYEVADDRCVCPSVTYDILYYSEFVICLIIFLWVQMRPYNIYV